MKTTFLRALALAVVTVSPAVAADKIPITKLADLPTHTYKIAGKPSELISDPAATLELARAVGKDIRADLAKYDIQDATAVRRMNGTLLTIAMLEGDDATAKELVQVVRAAQDKPAAKLTSGLLTESMLEAKAAPAADYDKTLQESLTKKLQALPYDVVQDNLKSAKGSMEIMSPSLVTGSLATSVDPAAAGGTLSQELAEGVINAAYAVQKVLPHKAAIAAAYTTVLDANVTAKKDDIWKARDVVLAESQNLTPVNVGVWDSGVDTKVYASKLWTNEKEVAGNAKDDDKNGFVDDVHGVAFTLHGDPTPELLMPIEKEVGDPEKYKADLKGFEDVQANVDSPEAQALKKKISGLAPDQIKPFIEGISAYSNYCHGTHVAGIAAAGNPAARILTGRITFDYRPIPETPTLEQAKKDVIAQEKTIAYFKQNGVRVVNMSWGGSLRSIETALEQNGAGGTPDERRALARKIYDLGYDGLLNAMKGAPDILFVVAAGNSNNDVKFDEILPSSFKLPNIVVAGAVDQAGEQTSFTSFGNCDLYANGFEVESPVPGGENMKLSGTSMAAPNVTNLAAKLWATHPKLTVEQVKSYIVQGAEERKSGDKTIKLMNPKASMALATAP